MTNTVVRVTGQLTITKAPITPGGDRRPGTARSPSTTRCVYGNDPPVDGHGDRDGRRADGDDRRRLFIGSTCTRHRGPGRRSTASAQRHRPVVGLACRSPTSRPQQVVVDSATTPVAVTVVNIDPADHRRVQRHQGGRRCRQGGRLHARDDVRLRDRRATAASARARSARRRGELPRRPDPRLRHAARSPRPASRRRRARPTGGTRSSSPSTACPPARGNSVTFEIPDTGEPVQVNVTNPITPAAGLGARREGGDRRDRRARSGRAAVHRQPGLRARTELYQLDVPADGSATQDGIPVGSACTATETPPDGGLVDASYAWGDPTYVPPDATVTVAATPRHDPGDQPDRPGHRAGAAGEDLHRPAGRRRPGPHLHRSAGRAPTAAPSSPSGEASHHRRPDRGHRRRRRAGHLGVHRDRGRPRAALRPTRRSAGRPRSSPARRSPFPGPNTITVANTLTRDNGTVLVRKVVTGATEGYIGWHRRGLHAARQLQRARPARDPGPHAATARSPTAAR